MKYFRYYNYNPRKLNFKIYILLKSTITSYPTFRKIEFSKQPTLLFKQSNGAIH